MHSASTFISAAPLILHHHLAYKRRVSARRGGLRSVRPRQNSFSGYTSTTCARPHAVLRQENTTESDFGYAPDHPLGVDLRDEEGKNSSASGATEEKADSAAASLEARTAAQTEADSVESVERQVGGDSTDIAGKNEIRIGVAEGPGHNTSTNGASLDAVKQGVIGLVKESTMTGHLRLPTGKEAALFAWESSIVIALIILLRAGVQTTLRWIHTRLSAARKDTVSYEESVWECMQRPLESVSVFTVATLIAEAVSRPLAAEGLLRYLRALRELGFIICAAWFLLRWIERIRIRYNGDKRADKAQVDATSRIATVATVVVSVLVSLDTVGINVQTVLAFGGIGGVAIGFAGREIISNFFGGFMIYVTRPFTVGEWVRSIEEAELNGTVEDIGWYLTRVRTWDKRPLYIPNSRFSTLIVENGSRMSNRRIVHTLNLRLEDVPVLPKVVAELTKLLMSHSELDPRQHRMAYVDGFGAYSVQVWLSCYTKSVFLYDFRRVQQEILLNAHEIIRSHGARLATATTRDVRPGVDIDRYGPFGSNASYRTPSNEPKVGETPPQPRFKLADIPGAPFFSQMHVDDNLLNIESGVSEESLAAALRMESPYPLPKEQKPKESTQPVGKQPSHTKQSSEVAVAAAAAALAAARRNQARIEEQNARAQTTSDASSKMNISTAPRPAETGHSESNKTGDSQSNRTMNIMAAPTSDSGSSSASTDTSNGAGSKSSASKSTTNDGGKSTVTPSSSTTETLAEPDSSSKSGGSGRKTVTVSRQTDTIDTDTSLSADGGRTMKISAVGAATDSIGNASTSTGAKDKKAETNTNANTNTASKSKQMEKTNADAAPRTASIGTATSKTTPSSRNMDSGQTEGTVGNDTGRTMKISAVSDSTVTSATTTSDARTTDGSSSLVDGDGNGKKSRPTEGGESKRAPNKSVEAEGTKRTMKISSVKKEDEGEKAAGSSDNENST